MNTNFLTAHGIEKNGFSLKPPTPVKGGVDIVKYRIFTNTDLEVPLHKRFVILCS